MVHPKQLSIKDYNYVLPEGKIAKFPLPIRDQSKLLIFNDGVIQENTFEFISNAIPENSLLVFNDTKVIQARLQFETETGAQIEIFCLEPVHPFAEIQQAMLVTQTTQWTCLVGNAKKWKSGKIQVAIVLDGQEEILTAEIIHKNEADFLIGFRWNSLHTFSEILEAFGKTPLPPYLKRDAVEKDKSTYQTVYAENNGAVAAPTAGLHFTENIFKTLEQKNIHRAFVTLHVGAGTFKPVKTETLGEHDMHYEEIHVNLETIENLILQSGKIIAVGTTSMRTLESLYWLGLKVNMNDPNIPEVNQWDPYTLPTEEIDFKASLQRLKNWANAHQTNFINTKTGVIIAPGYSFKVCDGLITNFHQPESTLLVLVHAFVGEAWKSIYRYALDNEFRFLSYGDSSILWR